VSHLTSNGKSDTFLHYMKITLADRMKLAGKEAVKLNLGNVVKSFGLPEYELSNQSFYLNSSTYRGLTNQNSFLMVNAGSMGQDIQLNLPNLTNGALTAFQLCAPVAAILLQKAQAYINGITYVMDAEGKKEATTEEAKKIQKLRKQPNPLQSGDQFDMQCYINTMQYGFTVILPIKPVALDGTYATRLWALPGNMLEYELNQELAPFKGGKPFKRITFVYGSDRTDLPLDEIFILKDSTPTFSTMAVPDSRLTALEQPMKNIIMAMMSRGKLIAQRGPSYVVSNAGKDSIGAIPMTPEEKFEIEQNFAHHYGLLGNQSRAIITSASLNVAAIGFDVKQLGLMEEVQESSSMLCIGLGFPKFLAGLTDPTFNNQDTAEKALYQRFLMPEAKNFCTQWDKFFNCEKYGLSIIKDYSNILQENQIDLGKARLYMNQACLIEFQNNIITWNEWRQANNLDTVSGMDLYYHELIAKGLVFGSSAGAATGNNNDNNNQDSNQN
jgi:hypothetical protein